MLESLLADVLTRVLGQYVSGIDRDHISFGVWGGCLELRDLTLRSESVAILAETFGLDIPVTAVAGYIGLLRVTVPWKTLSSTPVEVHIEHLTVVARPVSGDSSGANELAARERRLEKARLETDDAVREAAWAVRQEGESGAAASAAPKGWTGRLLSRIVENMQVEIHDVIVRFEDAFSDKRHPYCVAVMCKSIRAVSADKTWTEAYVDALQNLLTRKIITLEQFRVHWAPLQGRDAALAKEKGMGDIDSHAQLRAFVEKDANSSESSSCSRGGVWSGRGDAGHSRLIIDPFKGTMRASLIKGASYRAAVPGAAVELDIDFPDVRVTLNDVEYAALLQTSVYFAKLATRGFRPEKSKERWLWAVEQMLPGFRTRARAANCLTAEGMHTRNQQRSLYVSARTAVLKARRTGVPEPPEMAKEMERMEEELRYADLILYRDLTDRHIAAVCGDWVAKDEEKPPPGANADAGTTTGAFWSYLGYSCTEVGGAKQEETPDPAATLVAMGNKIEGGGCGVGEEPAAGQKDSSVFSDALASLPARSDAAAGEIGNSSAPLSSSGSGRPGGSLYQAVRAGIGIRRFSLHMHKGGFPNASEPMVELILRDLRLGCTTSTKDGMLVEAVLGTCEAWDLQAGTAMVYPRVPWIPHPVGGEDDLKDDLARPVQDDAYEDRDAGSECEILPIRISNSSYPTSVSSALRAIRSSYVPDEKCEDEDLLNPSRRPSRSFSRKLEEPKTSTSEISTDPLANAFNDASSSDGDADGDHPAGADEQKYAMSQSSSTRISTQEFLGNRLVDGRLSVGGTTSEFESLDTLVAFRLKHESAGDDEEGYGAGALRVVVEVAVGRLEAVVDGPRGTFLWGLQFWQPKGTADDPIMAFLGAAAGARIAALRMELKNAILAQQVPMRVEAVICAPRFILPGKTQKSCALVVNMGTFGFRSPGTQAAGKLTPTPGAQPSSSGSRVGEKYSSYSLSLDDLGIYLASNYLSSVSRRPSRKLENEEALENPFGLEQECIVNTAGVERIIRPFSLRLALHMLQDAQVVEVAQHGNVDSVNSGKIAKVRIRGRIPGIRLVLSQNACHQLIATGKRWAGDVSGSSAKQPPNNESESLGLSKEELDLTKEESLGAIVAGLPHSKKEEKVVGDEGLYAALTALEAKFTIDTVSLELRDQQNCRIITLVASGTRAEFEKTGVEGVKADFRLQSWTVTDGSRGTTAAFRRLAYAGVDSAKRGVSPPRSLAASSLRANSEDIVEDSFVHIQIRQNVSTNEQFVSVRFLSLNMVCVRETYARIAKFVYGTLKDLKEVRRAETSFLGSLNASESDSATDQTANSPSASSSPSTVTSSRRLVVKAVLDGFTFQLASAEGALAVIEMSNFAINGSKANDGSMTANGDVEYVAIRDLTSPLDEHSNALLYRRVPMAIERLEKEKGGNIVYSSRDEVSDGWSLTASSRSAVSDEVYLRCRFRGLKILFLNRFVSVVNRYCSILMEGLKPAFDEALAVAVAGHDDAPGGDSLLRRKSTAEILPAKSTRKYVFNVVAEQLELHIPRHSTCGHEAIILGVGYVKINNERNPVDGYGLGLRLGFRGIAGTVCYLVPGETAESAREKAPFLECESADYRIDMLRGESRAVSEAGAEQFPAVRCRFTAVDGIQLSICEAQYTVLYFVLTENFIETVDESVTDFGRSSPAETGTPARSPPPDDASTFCPPIKSGGGPSPVGAGKEASDSTFLRVVFQIPSFHMLVSRGWDVSQKSCEVLSVGVADLSGSMDVTSLSRVLVDITASIKHARDVRPEAAKDANVLILPLEATGATEGGTFSKNIENVTISYNKASLQRANIDLLLSGIQLRVIPELFRDLSCLALPGWPFLESSLLAPEVEYLGRTVSLSLSRSQVWLGSQQYPGDHRALILGGDVIARINWLQHTAAKKVSVQTKGLNLALTFERKRKAVPQPSTGIEADVAISVCDSDAVVMYPGDGSIEYIGPNVDDAGRRLEITAEFVLCRFNVKELPLIAAVFKRMGDAKESALAVRDWKQANPLADASIAAVIGEGKADSLAASQTIATRKTLTLLMSTGGARLLFTDESEGAFVPILEWNMRKCVVQANIPRVVQFVSEVSIDLFNATKGWWEPGLELWRVELSQSTGRSGAQAFAITSSSEMNLNVTPATISGATTVVNALQNAVSGAVMVVDDPHRSDGSAISSQRPSVAAFHVCNQLGKPLTMWLPHDRLRQSLRDGDEMKIDLPRDELIPGAFSGKRGDDHSSIKKALRCTLLLPGFLPLEVSAAVVGVHVVHIFRDKEAVPENGKGKTYVKVDEDGNEQPVAVVWEVKMDSGVPICTLRSTLRLLNETQTTLALCIRKSNNNAAVLFDSTDDDGHDFLLTPGAQLCVPLQFVDHQMRLRPLGRSGPEDDDLDAIINDIGQGEEDDNPFFSDEKEIPSSRQQAGSVHSMSSSSGGTAFGWSGPLPDTPWLLATALASQTGPVEKKSGASNFLNAFSAPTSSASSAATAAARASRTRVETETLRCPAAAPHAPHFFLTVSPRSEDVGRSREVGHGSYVSWLDIVLQAPVVLSNKLPGIISYRLADSNAVVRESGVLHPFKSVHVHSVEYEESELKLAIAFDNNSDALDNEDLNDAEVFGFEGEVEPPASFGEMMLISAIWKERRGIFVEPPASASSSGAFRKRDSKELCVQVAPGPSDPRRLEIWTQFWIRNRSDISLEVCGRSSFYSAGRASRPLVARPPGTNAGRFLCLEGPYISLRRMGEVDHAEWWTNPSDLGDSVKPVPVGIAGVSLVMEVRAAHGSLSNTMIITIRNVSWIVNRTPTPMQWCQSSALDSRGNCRMRDVRTLAPGGAQSVHWDPKFEDMSLSLRLADDEGDSFSGWFWSPPVPFDMGNKGEIPAKMYRPKSQEQYIARIVAIKLHGGSSSLFVYPQDSGNPPYRIVNNCRYRSIAFHQVESEDRPWLVRPGKSTRYSWDNPLAAAKQKELRIEVIEMAPEDWSGVAAGAEDVEGGSASSTSGLSSVLPGVSRAVAASWAAGKQYHHPKFDLNIDMVKDQATEKRGTFEPGLQSFISVDRATKVVTFRDEGEGFEEVAGSQLLGDAENSGEAVAPIVVWDDMSVAGELNNSRNDSQINGTVPARTTSHDYPPKASTDINTAGPADVSTDIDLNVYLASIGVSLVDSEPIELAYAHASGVFLKSERHLGATLTTFDVTELQVDNQLPNAAFPVLLWAPNLPSPDGSSDAANPQKTLALEAVRSYGDSEIIMWKSIRGAVRPIDLALDEEFVMRVVKFVEDVDQALVKSSGSPQLEIITGKDGEHLGIGDTYEDMADEVVDGGGKRQGSPLGLQRIYVQELKLFPVKIFLSSTASRGSQHVRSARYRNASMRTMVAIMLNVENCEFDFAALELRHVFDTSQHFIILVREYYLTQLNNQRMKLLASNSLIGNPAALFDSVSIGARDLFVEPGRAKGSAEFLSSVGRGSKSLFAHTVSGLAGSIGGIPKAVSSGLETAVGDRQYLAERERIRGLQFSGGLKPLSNTPAQGVATGAMSLAHGISSGVTGIFTDPVKGARQGGAAGFFKGVGKGLVGGIVKPVTGVMDLIAEPTTGFSRSVVSSVGRRRRTSAAPVRPPRAIPGSAGRLVPFHMRNSTGLALFRAVQAASSSRLQGELLDWVELSDRSGREDPAAVPLIWSVVQRYSRTVRGVRRPRTVQSESAASQETLLPGIFTADELARLEKLRVGLVLDSRVLVVTLDCVVVADIALESSRTFEVLAEGKDVVLRTARRATSGGGDGSSDFVHVWGRIECGSEDARKDLRGAIERSIELMRDVRELPGSLPAQISAFGSRGKSVEMTDIGASKSSTMIDLPDAPMISMKPVLATDGAGSGFGEGMPALLGRDSSGREIPSSGGADLGDAEVSSGQSESEGAESEAQIAARRLLDLGAATRRLKMGGTKRAVDSKRSIRIIVANGLPDGQAIQLIRSSLDEGFWREQPPIVCPAGSARMFEADSGGAGDNVDKWQINRDIRGSVLFGVNPVGGDLGGGGIANSRVLQVALEFFNPAMSSPSYKAVCSEGVYTSHNHATGAHATVVFTISDRDLGAVAKPALSSGSSASLPLGASRDSISSSVALPLSAQSLRTSSGNRSRTESPVRSGLNSSGAAIASVGSASAAGAGKLFKAGSRRFRYAASSLGASRPSSSSSSQRPAASSQVVEASVKQLMELGFERVPAIKALRESNGDIVKAVDVLTR